MYPNFHKINGMYGIVYFSNDYPVYTHLMVEDIVKMFGCELVFAVNITFEWIDNQPFISLKHSFKIYFIYPNILHIFVSRLKNTIYMISKQTLDAVNIGILTDSQLDEALKHYRELEKNLKCHGELYHLCWSDVYMKLITLEDFKRNRKK